MDVDRFDGFTRSLSTADASRRRALRVLGSLLLTGALGGVVAKLWPAESAEAKTGMAHRKAQKRSAHQAKDQRGELEAAGKHKKHHKKHKKPPPLPPGCQHCGTCEKCQDGACVPDPDLDLVRCLDSADDPGGQCHVCQSGQCVPYSNGSVCNDGDECSWCQNGQCVPVPEKDLGPCGHGVCHLCDRGVCGPAGNGTECTDAQGGGVCCNQTCIHPDCGRDAYDPYTCECTCGPGERRCGEYCFPANSCCSPPDPYPVCGQCEVVVCDNGQYVCRSAC
jgi:hypothetical protein